MFATITHTYICNIHILSLVRHVMYIYLFHRAFKLYVPEGGLRNNRKEFLWHHMDVQVYITYLFYTFNFFARSFTYIKYFLLVYM